MRKKFQIFISSTYEDLKKEREKVVAAILKSYHFPIGMEMFSADNVEQWEQIRRTIDSSDYYILIIKRRYGSMTKEGISFTEKEYNYAREQGIPVLSFIAGKNAVIENSDIEDNPEKLALLNGFIEKIKKSGYPCDFWNNADELCTLVNQALQKQFENNERIGWVKSDTTDERTDIKTLNENILLQNGKDVKYELARRNGDIRLAYDFIDEFDNRLISSIRKKTYIDNFNREIVLDIDGDRLKVAITTRIQYVNVKADINYYTANPRFETLEQARSYKHEEFSVNGVDYTDEIVSNIECTNDKRQFPYIVRNIFPIKYSDNIILVHKTSHIVPVNQFFHVYQLVFPCRSFLTTVIIKNNPDGRYRLRTSTFSSYNVHMYENYTSEYRKDDISTITISQWALPGAGYTVVLQNMGLPEMSHQVRNSKYDAKMEGIQITAVILLVYAADNPKGQIIDNRTLSSRTISVGSYVFNRNSTTREYAIWTGAIETLVSQNYIRALGSKGVIYEVTEAGYSFADLVRKQMPEIDTSADPKIYVNKYYEV